MQRSSPWCGAHDIWIVRARAHSNPYNITVICEEYPRVAPLLSLFQKSCISTNVQLAAPQFLFYFRCLLGNTIRLSLH
jgi:hypothetical protein